MSILIQQLAQAWVCVSHLEALGCSVLSVRASGMYEAARIHIADPGHLLDHVDAQSVDTSVVRYCERGVRLEGCAVFWLLYCDETVEAEA